MTTVTPDVTRGVRRLTEQRWLLNTVIRTVGFEWDQGRIRLFGRALRDSCWAGFRQGPQPGQDVR
jgi:hypothetical protein